MRQILYAIAPLALLGGLLAVWELACRGLHVATYLLPPPSAVVVVTPSARVAR